MLGYRKALQQLFLRPKALALLILKANVAAGEPAYNVHRKDRKDRINSKDKALQRPAS